MFERFTDAARRVVVGAQEEAIGLDHNYIGTEHILLGILRDEAGAGFGLLQLFEVPIDAIRRRVEEVIGRGGSTPAGHIPFTPRAKKVLELSLREALHLGDNFIGSEHILLGLLREGEGIGAQVLAERGVTLAGVKERLGDIEREPPPADDASVAAERDDWVRTGEPVTAQLEERVEAGLIEEGEDMIHVPAEHFARLVAEVARLRDLLRRHGIDPGEELPELGTDGEPPVA